MSDEAEILFELVADANQYLTGYADALATHDPTSRSDGRVERLRGLAALLERVGDELLRAPESRARLATGGPIKHKGTVLI